MSEHDVSVGVGTLWFRTVSNRNNSRRWQITVRLRICVGSATDTCASMAIGDALLLRYGTKRACAMLGWSEIIHSWQIEPTTPTPPTHSEPIHKTLRCILSINFHSPLPIAHSKPYFSLPIFLSILTYSIRRRLHHSIPTEIVIPPNLSIKNIHFTHESVS